MVPAQVKDEKSTIAIFDTFKTRKNKFTGEAKRQRGIIAHLATEQSPELRTRTSIAHAIAKEHGILWQNIYSGIFRDLDEVLIPAGVVKEGGRLPLRRGPRALQLEDRKSTRLNSSHGYISYAVFCLKKKRENRADRPACSGPAQ